MKNEPGDSLRPARMADVKEIHGLLKGFADSGLLLGRSLSSLYDHLRDYQVFIATVDGTPVIAGVCSLHICWEDLAEVRSLAVSPSFQGRGIGASLVRGSLAEAQRLGIDRVFTLTCQPDFFKKLGFVDVDKNNLPHKVWSDCVNCPKFPDCNEVAMMREGIAYDR